MAKYLEPAKEIDIAGEYDVIIVGGGPAGPQYVDGYFQRTGKRSHGNQS